MRKKHRKSAEDLALTIEVYARTGGGPWLYANHLRHLLDTDAGTLRRAIKILQDKGLIQGGRYSSNYSFGSVYRGMRRAWKFKHD